MRICDQNDAYNMKRRRRQRGYCELSCPSQFDICFDAIFKFENTTTFPTPHWQPTTANRCTFLSRLVMALSLWRMPTEAKYSSNNVQTIAWQHGTATKGILDISPESALTWKSWSPSVLEAAVASTFNGLTTWHEMTVIGKKVLVAEPRAILHLHCRISKSVSAANDLKIERTLREARNLHGFLMLSLRCPGLDTGSSAMNPQRRRREFCR